MEWQIESVWVGCLILQQAIQTFSKGEGRIWGAQHKNPLLEDTEKTSRCDESSLHLYDTEKGPHVAYS